MIKKLCFTLMVLSLSFVESDSSQMFGEEEGSVARSTTLKKIRVAAVRESLIFTHRLKRHHTFYYSVREQAGYFPDGELYKGPIAGFLATLRSKRGGN